MAASPGNPPDKYILLKLTGDQEGDELTINGFANSGYRFVSAWEVGNSTFVLMGNYKGN